MEREKGLEPSTLAMARRCSSQLSYSRSLRNKTLIPCAENVVKCLGADLPQRSNSIFGKDKDFPKQNLPNPFVLLG